MMANLPYQIMDSIEKLGIGWDVLLPLILFSLIFLYVSGIVQRARYRISISKINIHNRFKQYSYLDIMLNPAGGMPFMYAMSLVSIPQYVFMLIQFIHPENKWTSGAIKALTVGRPLWLVIYLVMLFVLVLAFAFVNVSGEQISESQSVSNSVSASESASISESQSVLNSESASTSASESSSEVKDPKQKRGSHALPKTGEENSSLSMIFGALPTATGLAFLAKRKKDEEGEDY